VWLAGLQCKYNNGPRTLPWGMPALIGLSSMYSVSAFINDCFYMGILIISHNYLIFNLHLLNVPGNCMLYNFTILFHLKFSQF
jgi:hypothetical protein